MPKDYLKGFEDCMFKDCTNNPDRRRIQEVTEVLFYFFLIIRNLKKKTIQ